MRASRLPLLRLLVFLISSIVLLSPASTLLWAGEPWKEKPWTEWTEKDVEKVLDKSPWTRRVQVGTPLVPVLGPASGPGVAEERGGILTESQWENERIAARASERGPRYGALPKTSVFGGSPKWRASGSYVRVRWVSSQTVRQAVARYWELKGQGKPEAARRLVSAKLEYYTIGISYSPAFHWQRDEVPATAYLELGKTKKKVRPVLVELVKGGGATPAADVLVHFPKEIEDVPLLLRSEKKVKFYCTYNRPSRPATLKVEFDVRKMVRDGKPDL